MSINVYKYLQDFEEMNDLPKENRIVTEDDCIIKKTGFTAEGTNNHVSRYSIDDIYFLYVKQFRNLINPSKNTQRFITELLYSKICEKNGVNCIKSFPFYTKNKEFCLASEDLNSIIGFDASSDNRFILDDPFMLFDFDDENDKESYYKNEWLLLTNKKLKDFLLSHMTASSFEQFVDMLIIDVLFCVWDRFGPAKNLFFLRKDKDCLIDGVVPIDLEGINVDALKYAYNNNMNKFFHEVYDDEGVFTTAHGSTASFTYREQLKKLAVLIKCGLLTDRQINLIRTILGYDITKEIDCITSKYNLDISEKIPQIYKEMWDRNAEILDI